MGGHEVLSQSQATPPQADTAPATQRVLPVQTITAEQVSGYGVQRSFTGTIAAVRRSNVGFERSGTLVAALVNEGDRVTKGQPLAKLDIQNLETQKLQLLAQHDQAEAQLSTLLEGARQEDIAAARAGVRDLEEQLRLQNVQRSRRQFLLDQGAISQEQLDAFAYGAASLRARIDQAKSNLQELLNGSRPQEIAAQQAVVQQLDASIADLDVTITKSTVKAPFDGIVGQRLADEGTVMGAGQAVVEILENSTPEARVGVPSNMLQQLSIGSSVSVDLGGQSRKAIVSSILPQVDAVTRTQEVVLKLQDAGTAPTRTNINPGQTVRLELTETIDAQGYWLPTTALTQGIRGLWNCYVVVPTEGDENAAEKFEVQAQAVEIVHQEGDRVLVRGTLQGGDRIVSNGSHRMVPGQAVEVASNG